MKLLAVLLFAVTVAFGVLRFIVPVHGLDLTKPTIFKDLAHVFVGILFGGFLLSLIDLENYLAIPGRGKNPPLTDHVFTLGAFMGALGVLLTVVEVIAFFARS